MYTRNLNSLSPNERGGLKIMIREYARPEIVAQHHLTNGAHGTNPGDGIRFFEWHREYLRKLEVFLQDVFGPRPNPASQASSPPQGANTRAGARGNNSGLAASTPRVLQLGPTILPFWEPWTEIPPEFLTLDNAGQVRRPTEITREHFSWWRPDGIGGWPNADLMGLILSWGPHFQVHFWCGGAMGQLQRAPQAPIFWPWHAFVDNIYSLYLQRGGKGGLLDPKSPPFGPQPPLVRWPIPPAQPGQGQTQVPFCLGASKLAATELIERAHLRVGKTAFFTNDLDMVLLQWPMPNLFVPQGTKVDLTSAQPCPCC